MSNNLFIDIYLLVVELWYFPVYFARTTLMNKVMVHLIGLDCFVCVAFFRFNCFNLFVHWIIDLSTHLIIHLIYSTSIRSFSIIHSFFQLSIQSVIHLSIHSLFYVLLNKWIKSKTRRKRWKEDEKTGAPAHGQQCLKLETCALHKSDQNKNGAQRRKALW